MQNSKISVYDVLVRFGGQWQRLAAFASYNEAKLTAKLTAMRYPSLAIRVRERLVGRAQ